MCSPSQGFYAPPTIPPPDPDRSDAADAARFRWMLNGNGDFLKEQGFCDWWASQAAQDDARRAIDKRMSQDAFDALTGHSTPSL